MRKILIRMLFVLPIFIVIRASAVETYKSAAPPASGKPFFEFDISGSAGNYNGQSYTEMHLGLNLNFTEWLTWRNSAFKRFSANGTSSTGLDTSLRYVFDSSFDGGGLNFFAGPGYRWADPSNQNALLAEAGVGLQLGHLKLGGGAKYLRYDKPVLDATGAELKKDDINYFITIAGGAGISF